MAHILSTVMIGFTVSILEAIAASVRLESNVGRELSRNPGKKDQLYCNYQIFYNYNNV